MTHGAYRVHILLALVAAGCEQPSGRSPSAPEGPKAPSASVVEVKPPEGPALRVPAAMGECAKSERLDLLVLRLEQQLPTLAACDIAEEQDGMGQIPLVVIVHGDGSIAARAVQPGRAPKSWACFSRGISSLRLQATADPAEWFSSDIVLQRGEPPSLARARERDAEPPGRAHATDEPAGREQLPLPVVQRVARSGQRIWRECHAQALLDDPQLTGEVEVDFVVDPDGFVSRASAKTTMADCAVAECTRRAFFQIVFPEATHSTTAAYPIRF